MVGNEKKCNILFLILELYNYVRHTFLLTCIPIFKLFSIRLTLRKALLRTRSILCIITNIYPLIYLQHGYLSLQAMDIGLFKHQQKKSIGNSSHLIKKQNRHTYILNFISKKLLFQENRTRYVWIYVFPLNQWMRWSADKPHWGHTTHTLWGTVSRILEIKIPNAIK